VKSLPQSVGKNSPPPETAWAVRGRGWIYTRQLAQYPRHVDYISRIELTAARQALPRAGRLLDLGAGTGRIASLMARGHAGELVALDPSASMLEQIDRRGATCPVRAVVGMSMDSLPFASQSFDGAYSFGVLNRFRDWRPLLRPVASALKPNGVAVFNNRSLDSIIAWGGLEPDSGFFRSADLDDEMRGMGLQVTSVLATPLLVPSMLLVQWAAPGTPIRPVMVFAMRNVLEAQIAALSDIEKWVEFEMRLAALLPAMAALQVIVVARVGSSDDRMTRREPINPSAAIRHLFAEPDVAELLREPAMLRLLLLLRPLLRRICGEDIVAAVFGHRKSEMDEAVRHMHAALEPSGLYDARMRLQKMKMDIYAKGIGLAIRLGRLI